MKVTWLLCLKKSTTWKGAERTRVGGAESTCVGGAESTHVGGAESTHVGMLSLPLFPVYTEKKKKSF